MNAAAKNELAAIKQELNSIIRELESISRGVRYDFKNIGNVQCADCIDNVIDQYYVVRRKLNNMDTETLTEGFGGGGGHSF